MRGRSRVRTAAVLVPAVAGGLLLALWAASAEQVALMNPSGRREFDESTPAAEPTPSASPRVDPSRGRPGDDVAPLDLSWIGELLSWTVLVLGAAAVLLALGWAWQHRWRRPPALEERRVDVLPEARVAEELRSDEQAHLDAVVRGSVRNGIVLCWVRLEESMAAAGLPRSRHETSAEFVVRVLHRLDLDPRAIGELAALYREARFSDHPLGEEARERARAALERLHADLRATGSVR